MKGIECFKKGRIIALIKEVFFKTGYSNEGLIRKPSILGVLKW